MSGPIPSARDVCRCGRKVAGSGCPHRVASDMGWSGWPSVSTVLVGDSHLARIRRDLHRIGEDVINLAVGGATIVDVPRQVARGVAGSGTFVVSVGTNDAHAERGIPWTTSLPGSPSWSPPCPIPGCCISRRQG